MSHVNCKYRQFEKSNLVYNGQAPASAEISAEAFLEKAKQELLGTEFFENVKGLSKKTPEEIRVLVEGQFHERYSTDAFRDYLEKNLPTSISAETKERLLKETLQQYEWEYRQAMAQFYRSFEQRIIECGDLEDEARTATKKALKSLAEAIEKDQALKKATPEIGETVPKAERSTILGKWPYSVPIFGHLLENYDIPIISRLVDKGDYVKYMDFRKKMGEVFVDEFLPALNETYLNLDRLKPKLNNNQVDEYKDLSELFQDSMEGMVQGQLAYIFETVKTPDDLSKKLEDLRDVIKGEYDRRSGPDEIMDWEDLMKIKAEIAPIWDVMAMMRNGESEEEIKNKLKGTLELHREAWELAAGNLTEEIIAATENNSLETSFIEAVKKDSKKPENLDFSRAKEEFRAKMSIMGKAGVTEALKFARDFYKNVFGDLAEIQSLGEYPASIRSLASVERSNLLNRVTYSENIDDIKLINFMSATPDQRQKLLENPTERLAVLQAVKNVLARPNDKNWDEWEKKAKKLPEKGEKKGSSKPGEFNENNQIAQYIALISLANEADWTIRNMDKMEDNKGQNLLVEYKATKKDPVLAPPFKFKDTRKPYPMRYTTVAESHGFTLENMAMRGAQAWAVGTIFFNFMNSRKGKGPLKWITEIDQIATKMAKNPYVLGSAGLLYGLHKYKEDPRYKGYFSETRGGQERINQFSGLRSLAKKDTKALQDFILNADEFKAMESMFKENPKQGINNIKKITEKASKRHAPYPMITKNDLKDSVDQAAWYELPDRGNEHMRYLFYSKFLTSEVNIGQLRQNCLEWLTS